MLRNYVLGACLSVQISNANPPLGLELDSVSQSEQAQLLDFFSKEYLDRMSEVQTRIQSLHDKKLYRLSPGSATNCYWAVQAFYNPQSLVEDFAIVSPGDFRDWLDREMLAVEKSEVQRGDLVVLEGDFETWVVDDRVSQPAKTKHAFTSPYHAAIVVGIKEGDPLLFQKLNYHDARFAFMSLNGILEYYSRANVRDLRKSRVLFFRKRHDSN